MPLGIAFYRFVAGFLEPTWSKVGTIMGSKIDLNFEGRKPTKR